MVDAHCHIFCQAAKDLVEKYYSQEQILLNDPYDRYAGQGTTCTNRTLLPELRPKMTDPALRVADMDRLGIDIQVLASFVSQFYYWTDPALGHELARLQNHRLAEMVAAAPDRFTAVGTVPMQDSERAVQELDYVVQTLGFKGVQISSNITGRDLDDLRFRPFFRRAEELGAVVLLHPNGFTDGERFQDFFLMNVIGNPMDSTLALTRLIFSGALAQHPDLRLCVVHGGGYLPFYSARMDHAWQVRPECRERIEQPPSTYLRQVYFDTMVFSPRILENLVEFAGVQQVLLGTDYPFDMGESDPLGLIDGLSAISPKERAGICGGNATTLFGI
ncbi:amidohydrolase family protein [Salinactinospora qingdaonensis]|uniref:Amidohydrolase family protein n=1 Tax=Salinactinospora qingdaonensis TaxID=702744 RepID=A0ABP7FWM9_9ACTN